MITRVNGRIIVTDTNVNFRDFTKKRSAVFFNLDGERFDCAPAVPVTSLQELANYAGEVNSNNAADFLQKFFGLVMDADNQSRIAARMVDKTNPLDMDQALEIMHWLLEAYGMRPTQSSSDISTGSPTDGDGTPSMAGA